MTAANQRSTGGTPREAPVAGVGSGQGARTGVQGARKTSKVRSVRLSAPPDKPTPSPVCDVFQLHFVSDLAGWSCPSFSRLLMMESGLSFRRAHRIPYSSSSAVVFVCLSLADETCTFDRTSLVKCMMSMKL